MERWDGPGRSGDHDDFGEEIRASDGGNGPDDGGDRVGDEDAGVDVELLEESEDVVGVALEGCLAVEVEVVGVGGAGAHVVEEDDAVVVDKVGDQVLPHRLVRAEAVGQHDGLIAGAQNLHIVGFFHDSHLRPAISLCCAVGILFDVWFVFCFYLVLFCGVWKGVWTCLVHACWEPLFIDKIGGYFHTLFIF